MPVAAQAGGDARSRLQVTHARIAIGIAIGAVGTDGVCVAAAGEAGWKVGN